MTTITTITLSYDRGEDRIHIAARLSNNRQVRFWLTQRLARRLVTALAGQLEKAEAIPLPRVRDAMMAQAQAEAVSGIEPCSPVTAEPQAPAHVIRNIALKVTADQMLLQFDSPLDEVPNISLNHTHVRQWLSMLHRQFVTAEWPLDVWPIWLTEGSRPGGEVGTTRH